MTLRRFIRNNYKSDFTFFNMDNKRGQVAIWVIIGLILVSIVIILLLYSPSIIPGGSSAINPSDYLKTCISADVNEAVSKLSRTGGYSNPEGYINYKGEKIKYLCYTSEFYRTCVVQQPMIKENFEKEISVMIKPVAVACVKDLEEVYKQKGYSVSSSGEPSFTFSFDLEKMKFVFNTQISATKGGVTQTFNGIKFEKNSKMYEILMISQSIIDYEASLGDSEITMYSSHYPDLVMGKFKLSDESKIYTLRNVKTNESFQFASRSLAWPTAGEYP